MGMLGQMALHGCNSQLRFSLSHPSVMIHREMRKSMRKIFKNIYFLPNQRCPVAHDVDRRDLIIPEPQCAGNPRSPVRMHGTDGATVGRCHVLIAIMAPTSLGAARHTHPRWPPRSLKSSRPLSHSARAPAETATGIHNGHCAGLARPPKTSAFIRHPRKKKSHQARR